LTLDMSAWAFAGGRPLVERLLDAGQLTGAELDFHGSDVLLEVANVLGARDRDDVIALMEHQARASSAELIPFSPAISCTRATSSRLRKPDLRALEASLASKLASFHLVTN
jgi:hypothetical protein